MKKKNKMTTKKIKELDVPVDKQSGSYTATMSFSTPSPGFVYVQLTDQDGNELWRELITESPVTLEAGFSHTNLTKLILNRFESNAHAVTSYIFELYKVVEVCTQNFIVYDHDGTPVSGGWTVHAEIYEEKDGAFIEEKTCTVDADGLCSLLLPIGRWIESYAKKNDVKTTGRAFEACTDRTPLSQFVTCDNPTPNHVSGCDLLLYWDTDNDGIISYDEMVAASHAYDPLLPPEEQTTVTLAELGFLISCYSDFAGVIANKCPGCVYVIDICSWITGLGGWEAIMTSHIMDLVSGYLGIKDLGFTVTIAYIMGVVAYYLNQPESGDSLTDCDFFP